MKFWKEMTMNKSKYKEILAIIGFLLLLSLAGILYSISRELPDNLAFLQSLMLIISIGIYISIFTTWTISIYKRIMQRHVRMYLMLIGVSIIFWISIRAVKWGAFNFLDFEDRMMWYMFYIPMIMIPLLCFYTALCVGKGEKFRLDKKWYLLLIPSALLMILVLTNNFHMTVFYGYDIDKHLYGQSYSYGVGYYVIAVFILALCIMSLFLIVKRFTSSAFNRKASSLPMLVILMLTLYTVIHAINPAYGIAYYVIDVTIFACATVVAFWESCIRKGLIHSNQNHNDFFAMADIRAQILNKKGEVIYMSENTLPITNEQFNSLVKEKTISINRGTLLNMAKISGGYVVWKSDISQIREIIENLKMLNIGLSKEVDILTLENEEKRESARLKKLNELHSRVLVETLPYSEKIKGNIIKNKDDSLENMKNLLFETSMLSAYIKRKINLILTEQTEKCISTDEMHRAFSELFQLPRFYGKDCVINVIDDFDMSLDVALLCYDLVQKVFEKLSYSFSIIYTTFRKSEKETIFTVVVESDVRIDFSEFKSFEKEKISCLNGKISLEKEGESHYFTLSVSN